MDERAEAAGVRRERLRIRRELRDLRDRWRDHDVADAHALRYAMQAIDEALRLTEKPRAKKREGRKGTPCRK